MRLVLMSDTHGYHRKVKVPDGDILIHAGDCTDDIGQKSLRDFLHWMRELPHRHKLFIAGNHDGAFEKFAPQAIKMCYEEGRGIHYLEDSCVTIEGLRIWGSPVTPSFCNWYFNRDRGPAIKRHWDLISPPVDVLVTHGPPAGILDVSGFDGASCGCADLHASITRIQPKLHVFGHIHHSYGTRKIGDITFINASICDERYHPVRQPFIYDLDPASTQEVRGPIPP